jgi:hypothetical protein
MQVAYLLMKNGTDRRGQAHKLFDHATACIKTEKEGRRKERNKRKKDNVDTGFNAY